MCDPSSPANIDKLKQAGLDAEKANNEVVPGIAAVGGRFAQKILLVHRSCVALSGELRTYSWKQRKDNTIIADEPNKVNDHSMDALRYAVMAYLTQRRSWWADKKLLEELYGPPPARDELARAG
jgi:phage terminase large subunit